MSDKELQIGCGAHSELRFIFLGMASTFSYHVLLGLLRAGKIPAAVWISTAGASDGEIVRLPPEPVRSELPLVNPFMEQSVLQLAWEHEIDVYAVGNLAAEETVDALAQIQASLGIMACFPQILPPSLLIIPKHGFLNLHPSMLPKYRGPEPLFWQFRDGLRTSGVTLHHVDRGVDSGDIVEQEPVIFSDGLSQSEADVLCAQLGAKLVIGALTALTHGDLKRRPQSGDATYFGRPDRIDFHIPLNWTARRAFNFMRGTEGWQRPYRIHGQDFIVQARSAVAYSDRPREQPFIEKENEAWINFRRGSLHVLTW